MNETIQALVLRDLQRECALALACWKPTNNELSAFSKQAHHDSQQFYRAVIAKYWEDHGGLPSQCGPAQTIRLIHDL